MSSSDRLMLRRSCQDCVSKEYQGMEFHRFVIIIVILFKLNCEFNVVMSPVQVMQKTQSIIFVLEKSKGIVHIPEPNSRLIMLFSTHFSSKSHMKMFAKTGPSGEPIATPSIWSQYCPSKTKWLFFVANKSKFFRTNRGKLGGFARAYIKNRVAHRKF